MASRLIYKSSLFRESIKIWVREQNIQQLLYNFDCFISSEHRTNLLYGLYCINLFTSIYERAVQCHTSGDETFLYSSFVREVNESLRVLATIIHKFMVARVTVTNQVCSCSCRYSKKFPIFILLFLSFASGQMLMRRECCKSTEIQL